jgi:carotenoid cleavage dioxygenase-like enzyme
MFVSAGFPRRIENVFGVGGAAFTAHPHVDPCTSRLVAWSWSSLVAEGAVETTFFEWGKDWEEPFTPVSHKLDACEAAPHDFAVTQNHYVLIQNRLKVDPVPYLLGLKGAGECLVSQPELPVVVHVIPRPTRSDAVAEDEGKAKASRKPAVSADGPRASFEIHVAFAHDGKPIPFESSEERSTATATGKEEEEEEEKEEDDDADWVTAYTAGWDELAPGSFLGEWKKSQPWPFPVATSLSPDFNNIPRTVLWRYAVNLKTKACVRTIAPGCEDLCIDHPHVNPLFEGRRECRYVYVSLSNESRTSGPPLGYARVDLKTGETQKWYAGNKTFCEELVIVPKRGGWIGKPSATTSEEGVPENTRASVEEEQECWLLGMLADHETVPGQSCLAILDGADVAAGPVAKIYLKHRVPHGLHGAFVPKSA